MNVAATDGTKPEPITGDRSGVQIVGGELEIPAVETVFASVGNDVTRKPKWAFLSWVCEEKCTTPTVDAVDLRIRLKGFFGRTHNREYCGFET